MLGAGLAFKDSIVGSFTSPLSGSGVLAGLNLSGKLRDDPASDGDLSYRIGLTFAGKSDGSVTKSKDGLVTAVSVVRGFSLADVAVTWDLLSIKSGLDPAFVFNTTLGQFLKPFGNENVSLEDKKPTIKSAQYISPFGIGRDIGLQIDAGFWNVQDDFTNLLTSSIAFTGALLNGSGGNAEDPNKGKDVILKTVLTPVTQYFNPLYGLKVGGSVQFTNLSYDSGKFVNQHTLLGAQFEYLKKPLLITAEFVQKNPCHSMAVKKKSRSAVATLFYTGSALPDFQPLIRYDWYDPDVTNDNPVNSIDDTQVVTVGFNWYIYAIEPVSRQSYSQAKTERVVKIQINYNARLENKNAAQVKNDELLGLLVFSF
jgi:hypothetical protein